MRMARQSVLLGVVTSVFAVNAGATSHLPAGVTLDRASMDRMAGSSVDMAAFEYPADCYPHCNGDGVLTIADVGCFQSRYVSGCP